MTKDLPKIGVVIIGINVESRRGSFCRRKFICRRNQ